MSKLKFIIIHCSSLTQRWYNYYFYEELVQEFDFEYWDCSKIAYPYFTVKDPIDSPNVKKISSLEELIQQLETLPTHSQIALDIHRCEQNYKLLKIISTYKKNIIYINFFSNTINQTRLEKLIEDYTSYKNIRRKFFSFLFKRMFNSTIISCENNSRYRINHPDYETSLLIANNPPIIPNSKYIVYLDNNFPFHPEIKYREPSLDINKIAVEFYASLNLFFDNVEKYYNCPVIIAAHPAANYTHNPYGNRKLIKNQTGILIRDSMGVLMHTSNAVSFAYLYNKPVSILYNKGYKQSKKEFKRLLQCHRVLKFPLINTDNYKITDIFKEENNKENRDEYINKYLVNPQDKRSNRIKIIQYIKDIDNRTSKK